jgi:cytoskeleton protein RodZ
VENISEEQNDSAVRTSDVGATLRAARDRTGKGLAEVATLLRIRQPYLQALEEGRHRDLPGGTYAVGFLRTYADFLGLDGEEMVRRFRAEAADGLHSRSELVFPSPVSEGRVPGGAILFLGLLFAAIAYGGWYWLSSRDKQVTEMVPPLPDRLSSLLNRPAALNGEPAKPQDSPPKPDEAPPAKGEAATPPAPAKDTEIVPPPDGEDDSRGKAEPAKAEPVKAEPVKAEPAKAEPAGAAKPARTAAEPPKPAEAAKPVESSPPPQVVSQDAAGSRVSLTAGSDDCWIQVREMDGQLLVSRLLRKGDSYAVPNRPGLMLMVGNAGALDVTVDGRKTPSLGASGLVRRDIRLDPERLQAGGN